MLKMLPTYPGMDLFKAVHEVAGKYVPFFGTSKPRMYVEGP